MCSYREKKSEAAEMMQLDGYTLDYVELVLDADRTRKHGIDEFISADPCKFDHHKLFRSLQTKTLDYRLNDLYCSLCWFSPEQIFCLDEYCACYGVRSCYRHLCYLHDLLD